MSLSDRLKAIEQKKLLTEKKGRAIDHWLKPNTQLVEIIETKGKERNTNFVHFIEAEWENAIDTFTAPCGLKGGPGMPQSDAQQQQRWIECLEKTDILVTKIADGKCPLAIAEKSQLLKLYKDADAAIRLEMGIPREKNKSGLS